MPKKIPMRQCLGCREMKPKRELIRVVRSPQGEISLDFHGKKPGRGAYLCPNQDCLKRARKSKALERAFSLPIPDDVYASLEAQMEGGGLDGIAFPPFWAWRSERDGWPLGKSPSGQPAGGTKPTCCCWPATRRTTPSAGPLTSASPQRTPSASSSP